MGIAYISSKLYARKENLYGVRKSGVARRTLQETIKKEL